MKIISIAVFVLALMVAGPAMAQTDCNIGAFIFAPEPSPVVPEVASTISCTGFKFASAETAVFFDPGGLVPSDILLLSNVNGVATIAFTSDAEFGLTPPANFITVNEPNPFVVIAFSTTGGADSVLTFTSDADTAGVPSACGVNSDCLSVSATPEPATLALLGIGILGGGFMRRRRRSGPAGGEK
jgi:PEP-CTERM motif